MNLNLHIVDLAPVSLEAPRLDLEHTAYDALVSGADDVGALKALAEYVDWEAAVLEGLSGLGMRCERALRQRLLRLEDGRALEALAAFSGTVNDLFRELTRMAEGPEGSPRLAA